MKVLVTGGCGFIGSNFIRYLLQAYPEAEVLNFDKLTYAGNPKNLADLEDSERYCFVKGDICDEEAVEAVFKWQPEIVVNFAAETHVDRSLMGPRTFVETDVLGTFTLLEAARRHGLKRYLQISTDEVYGSLAEGAASESAPLNPSSPYSASKAGADLQVLAYWRSFGVPALITRASNNFGPYQYPEKLIPLFITNLIEDKQVPLYGDGLHKRDWLYVEDHCRALALVLEKGEPGEIYNVGTGEEKTNLEITHALLHLLDKDTSAIKHVKDRPGHDRRYALECSKLRALGWEPVWDFEEALRATVEWYKANPDWWRPLKSGEYLEYYKRQYEKR